MKPEQAGECLDCSLREKKPILKVTRPFVIIISTYGGRRPVSRGLVA